MKEQCLYCEDFDRCPDAKRARRGRPKKDIRKEKIVKFRMTEEEWRELVKYSLNRGMNVSEMIRDALRVVLDI